MSTSFTFSGAGAWVTWSPATHAHMPCIRVPHACKRMHSNTTHRHTFRTCRGQRLRGTESVRQTLADKLQPFTSEVNLPNRIAGTGGGFLSPPPPSFCPFDPLRLIWRTCPCLPLYQLDDSALRQVQFNNTNFFYLYSHD